MCIHCNRNNCWGSVFILFLLEDAVLKDMKCAKFATFKGNYIPFFSAFVPPKQQPLWVT